MLNHTHREKPIVQQIRKGSTASIQIKQSHSVRIFKSYQIEKENTKATQLQWNVENTWCMPGWLQKKFIGTFSHLYGRTYIQLHHENLNNLFTAALQYHSHQNLRSKSLLYYFYLACGSLLLIYESSEILLWGFSANC